MKIGFIGLGRMGMNMVSRLIKHNHNIVVYNRSPDKIREAMKKGAEGAFSLKELAEKLPSPRVIFIMVPAGDPVDKMITGLIPGLTEGDIVIDGGNSNYHDSMRRAEYLSADGISYLDMGTSGGLGGEKIGYCLMVGGEKKTYDHIEPVLKALAAEDGYGYMGPSGAGHYVKMVHNGIEYALLQSYGEGFELLHEAPFDLDLNRVANVWKNGSVVRSWLLELLQEGLEKYPDLEELKDHIGGGSTGTWTVEESLDLQIPSPMISLALALRFRSRQKESFADKSVAVMRNGFGGHEIKFKKK
ncbi:decarboxylating 6-phosphogluconate dehydrogenase [Candidatus Woesearchaeota archaeon]|nr:decarboxylating 6-phosphogluconate dehydrogenase [Candidatus Woesearchaeota archaeon]